MLDSVPSNSSDLVEFEERNGDGFSQGLPHSIYFGGRQIGCFVACYRGDVLPDEGDRLIMQVAANQVTLLLQRDKDQEERLARKLAEDRLRQTEHHYQQLVQSLPAAIYTCDTAGRLTLYNEAAVALWGRRPNLGEGLGAVHGKSLAPMARRSLTKIRPWASRFANAVPSADRRSLWSGPMGLARPFSPHPDPIYDESGNIVGTVNMLVLLDALKRAQEDVRTRQAQLQAIIDNTPECVKLVAADGTLLAMNGVGLCMVEADKADDVLGHNIYKVVAAEFRDAFQRMNERVCAGAKERLEFEIVGLRGTRRWLETHAAPIVDPQSGQRVHLAVTRDITSAGGRKQNCDSGPKS